MTAILELVLQIKNQDYEPQRRRGRRGFIITIFSLCSLHLCGFKISYLCVFFKGLEEFFLYLCMRGAYMLYRFVKILSRIVCLLPNSVRRVVGKALGSLCWQIVPRKRKKMAIENIMISLSMDQSQAAHIAKQSTTRFGNMFLEVLCMPKIKKDNIENYVQLEGREYLTEALSHGKGVVLATAHSDNWELLGAGLAMHGFPIVGVAQKQTNPEMDRFINEYRNMSGMEILYKSGVRDMVKVLSQGRIVGILMDQDAHRDGVMVEFFGRLASTAQGAAALARLKDAPIIPIFITENSDGTHTVIIHPTIWVEKTSNRDQDIFATTQQLTIIIEQHIRKYPHEWFWLHNRWKHTPPVN